MVVRYICEPTVGTGVFDKIPEPPSQQRVHMNFRFIDQDDTGLSRNNARDQVQDAPLALTHLRCGVGNIRSVEALTLNLRDVRFEIKPAIGKHHRPEIFYLGHLGDGPDCQSIVLGRAIVIYASLRFFSFQEAKELVNVVSLPAGRLTEPRLSLTMVLQGLKVSFSRLHVFRSKAVRNVCLAVGGYKRNARGRRHQRREAGFTGSVCANENYRSTARNHTFPIHGDNRL